MSLDDRRVYREMSRARRDLDDLPLPEVSVDLVRAFMAFSGKRGLWVMDAFDSNGDAQDGTGHGHHLSYNGNPTYNVDNVVPYIDLDGTGDYLSFADDPDVDILGTETYVAAALRGLTVAGCVWLDTQGSAPSPATLASKFGAVGQYSWAFDDVGTLRLRVSVDGTALVTLTSTLTLATAGWHFVAARFDPSTELKVWLDSEVDTETSSIPASLFNSNADFALGGLSGGSNLMDGRWGPAVLCACAVPDALICGAYEEVRAGLRI